MGRSHSDFDDIVSEKVNKGWARDLGSCLGNFVAECDWM